MQGNQQQLTPQQQNMMARAAVISQALDMRLPIYSQTFTAAASQGPGTVINVPPRNVGLIKRFVIEVSGSITPVSGNPCTLTALGGGNFFDQVVMTDLSNQQRISTTGWHLAAVSSAKRRRPYGSASALDAPDPFSGATRIPNAFGYGNNSNANYLPSSIPGPAAVPFKLFFELPIAYTDHDLRGAIYANVTNATMNIQLRVNPSLFAVTGARNAQHAMYTAATVPTLTSYTITIHQHFFDQLPISQQGGAVIPLLDISTAYLLNNTSVSGVVNASDNPIPYANFRDFMSFCCWYDDPAAFTSTTMPWNYLALQSANYTNIFKEDVPMNQQLSRQIIGCDFPLGMIYEDFRSKPLSTIQYGNLQMLFNPSTVTDNQTNFQVGFESLALINMITQAGSLYGS
jgi:hypothetical protein